MQSKPNDITGTTAKEQAHNNDRGHMKAPLGNTLAVWTTSKCYQVWSTGVTLNVPQRINRAITVVKA